MRVTSLRRSPAAVLALVGLVAPTAARPRPHPRHAPAAISPSHYAGLRWRNVGPFRAGRVAAVSGVIGQPGVFYAGLPAGGVWKTTSAGVTWFPIFDSVRTVSSVGAVEVAPSDPNVVYVGTGDLVTGGAINEGDGVYKSIDAGRTWQHLGLAGTKQIPSILVDPGDPNIVLIAAQGNLHRRGGERGVYRSADGGRTWTNTLPVKDDVGVQKLARAFDEPSVIFATTAWHYTPPTPPVPGARPDTGKTGTSIYKSIDGGLTWQEISGHGLPHLSGRTSIAVAMNTHARRVFFIDNSGLYRSDDGGATWRRMAADDARIRNGQGGYNCGVYVDPQNPDVVYTISTSSYRSTDGGNTFTGFKGAPGGDDPQQMWIDPTNGQRILLGMDQGATITLDGGANWSSWYNQSTEQVYHISVDESWPSWIYATQQDAGAIRTRARGNFGAITPLDWNPVSGWEWGTIVADPLDPNIVYGSGFGIRKITDPSEQWTDVSPAVDPGAGLRVSQSQPLVWAPWNRRELLAGFQYLMSTVDGGVHWTKLSPDVTTRAGEVTVAAGPFGNRNAIESISASSVAAGTIWIGTNNGRIEVTRDHGRSWSDASIANLPARAEVLTIESSHHDAAEAYAAVSLHRTGDYAPYFYRTRDLGRTWTRIVDGLPTDLASGSFARVIRADTRKAGLLFAGTESSVYVSFDDGDHWLSLAQNLPVTSYRDMVVHGNDLVVGSYGRGIWILDDISVLRQLTPDVASAPAHIFAPGEAVRVRRNVNDDTPFPPEVPHALNAPDGVIIDYWLASKPGSPITIFVLDSAGRLVRRLSSEAITPVPESARPPEPNFWIAAPEPLPAEAGENRAHWDLRYDAPPAFAHTFEINANPGLTPASPEGPLAPPGTYTLRLTVDGRSYSTTVRVRNDPRSPATAADLRAQHVLLMKLTAGMRAAWDGDERAVALRSAARVDSTAPAELAAASAVFAAQLDSVLGSGGRRGFQRGGAGAAAPTFRSVGGAMTAQLQTQDKGDTAPTPAMLAAFTHACRDLENVENRWVQALVRGLPAYNAIRKRHGLAEIAAPNGGLPRLSCE